MTLQEFCEIKAELAHSGVPIKTQEKLIRILTDVMGKEAEETEENAGKNESNEGTV